MKITKITTLFLSGFIIGFGYFAFVLLAMIIGDEVKDYKELDVIKKRGFIMVREYDARKNRCEVMGGKYNVVETNTYYNEWCSGYVIK